MTTSTIGERADLANQVQERFKEVETGLWQKIAANAAEIKRREAKAREESCLVQR